MHLSTLPQPVPHDPPLASEPLSGDDIARRLRMMARPGKVSFITPAESGSAQVEIEILLYGIVVLKAEARLDAAGLQRLRGLMAAASLLEW